MNGVKIRKMRKSLGITQAAFADVLGVSVDSVRRWEQGTREPSKLACNALEALKEGLVAETV